MYIDTLILAFRKKASRVVAMFIILFVLLVLVSQFMRQFAFLADIVQLICLWSPQVQPHSSKFFIQFFLMYSRTCSILFFFLRFLKV